MALYQIPFDSAEPHYRFECDLEGTRYVFVVDWNSREEAWFLSLELPDGTQLLDGRRIVIGQPLLERLRQSTRPPGELVFLDTESTEADPGRYELGGRVTAVYLERADLPG